MSCVYDALVNGEVVKWVHLVGPLLVLIVINVARRLLLAKHQSASFLVAILVSLRHNSDLIPWASDFCIVSQASFARRGPCGIALWDGRQAELFSVWRVSIGCILALRIFRFSWVFGNIGKLLTFVFISVINQVVEVLVIKDSNRDQVKQEDHYANCNQVLEARTLPVQSAIMFIRNLLIKEVATVS